MIFRVRITKTLCVEIDEQKALEFKLNGYVTKSMLPEKQHAAFERLRVPVESNPSSTVYKPANRYWDRYRNYRRRVWDVTNAQPIHILPGHAKRGRKGYHLDHKTSVMFGFENNINPEEIGHITNLRFIPYKENFKKGHKSVYR